MKITKQSLKRIFWALFIVCVSLLFLFQISADLAESLYGHGIYRVIRNFLDCLILPVSSLKLTLFIVISCFIYLTFRHIRKSGTIVKKIKSWFIGFGYLLAFIFMWFYFLWGFNYSRPDLTERMEIETVIPDTTWLFNEIRITIDTLNKMRSSQELMVLDDMPLEKILSTSFDIKKINRAVSNTIARFGYDSRADPVLRFIEPDGFLLHWSTAGMYWPFTGECQVDRGVHFIRKPFTIAHELAHAHGLTSEGDCNFIAYLACKDSEIMLHRYSAQLSLLGYLMRDALKVLGREGLAPFYNRMLPALKADRQDIFDHHNKYEDYLPTLRNKVYDSYLKSQGVSGGLDNYNYFVRLKYQLD